MAGAASNASGGSIFGASDPIALFGDWLSAAEDSELNDPNAIALATVDAAGRPNVRVVLLKEIEANAFVFYTNYESTKGREIEATGQAAFVIHWKSLRRQIRVRGEIAREDGAQADAYYASRGLDSRLGAWASRQSRPLSSRAELTERMQEARRVHGETPQRPSHWGGFRLTPLEVEFWQDGAARLHDREVWSRHDIEKKWEIQRLYP